MPPNLANNLANNKNGLGSVNTVYTTQQLISLVCDCALVLGFEHHDTMRCTPLIRQTLYCIDRFVALLSYT